MDDIRILPLIVDLVGSFFGSSRDALDRARQAKNEQQVLREPTGLNIFSHRRGETQASLETIIFSFLTAEAMINYLFFNEQRSTGARRLDRWLRQRWKRGLSIQDRFVLLVSQYSLANLDDFHHLEMLFSEFVTFRNRIVHTYPEQYDALVQPGDVPDEVFIHDVEAKSGAGRFPVSGLAGEIARIDVQDAECAFEIMLLVLSFLDEQLYGDVELWWPGLGSSESKAKMRPRAIVETLHPRHYPSFDVSSFVRKADWIQAVPPRTTEEEDH